MDVCSKGHVRAMTQTTNRMSRLFTLLRNQDGNVLWLTTAALFPMIFLIGSGVDLSRAYMVKTRLQAACDAGALAGRRAMGNNEWDPTAEAKAKRMFNANFRSNDYGAQDTQFTVGANDRKNVVGSTTAKLPPLIFSAFGAGNFNLSANCESELNITDIDVAFVLDVTGSMSCTSSDLETCAGPWADSTQSQAEKSGSKIQALRSAVSDFDRSVKSAAGQNTEIRYAFVPYSSKVRAFDPNGGNLALASSFVKTQHMYRTRKARFTLATIIAGYTNVGNQTSTQSRLNNCQSWATNNGNIEQSGGVDYRYVYVSYNSSSRVCTRTKQQINYSNIYKFREWTYGSFTMNTSKYIDGGEYLFQGSINQDNYIPAENWDYGSTPELDLAQLGNAVRDGKVVGLSSANNYYLSRWKGCVEEADTVAGSSFTSIPSGAQDFDFFNKPSSPTWKPAWGDVIYTSDTSHPTQSSDACPKVMRRLNQMSASDITNYLSASNGFVPVGGTYHDVGMLWGVRMLAQNGVFGDEQKDQVSRHIIFMSDGKMSPNSDSYTAYGIEQDDKRVSGISNVSNSVLTGYHNKRYVAACDAAKARGITVWVIAFGTTMSSDMTNCASPGKTFSASNNTQLTKAFQDIASRIADLRIVQ